MEMVVIERGQEQEVEASGEGGGVTVEHGSWSRRRCAAWEGESRAKGAP